jgi:cellulase
MLASDLAVSQPVYDPTSAAIVCNQNFVQPVSSKVVDVPAGAQIGTAWGHVIGGPQVPNDPNNPIAPSHHGPMIYYLAKVDNAATTGTSGLQWFKIYQDGMDGNGVWGIDRMFSNGGWGYVTIPACVAPGNYLLRAEALALHSAYSAGGAQFVSRPWCVRLRRPLKTHSTWAAPRSTSRDPAPGPARTS